MKSSRAKSLSFLAATSLTIPVGLALGADNTAVYPELIAPVMEAKCASCHGEKKQKGKLRVDTFELLKKGGSEGPGVVAGNLEESGLTFRMALPHDDDEHMPPEDKDQLTDLETKIIIAWVKKGGTKEMTVAQLGNEFKAPANQLLASLAGSTKAPTPAEKKATAQDVAAAKAAMSAVNATGASLMPIAQNTPELRFSALNVSDKFGDKDLMALKPVAGQIAWADLARTQITDSGLAAVSGMTNLKKLHLEQTKIGDAGLAHLAKLENLEYLNLYATNVTDAGLQKLAGLKKLSRLYLWQSKATPAGADKLKATNPNLRINLGWEYESKAKTTQVASTKPAAPAPKATPPKKAAPKPAPKPTPKPKAAPKAAVAPVAIAAPTIASVESKLTSALVEANRLLAAANMDVSSATQAAAGANAKIAKAKAAADSKSKAAAELKGPIADFAMVVSNIEMALNSAKGKKGLEKLVARLTDDLNEAKEMQAAQQQAYNDAKTQANTAGVALSKVQNQAKTQAAAVASAKSKASKFQALAKSVTDALAKLKG